MGGGGGNITVKKKLTGRHFLTLCLHCNSTVVVEQNDDVIYRWSHRAVECHVTLMGGGGGGGGGGDKNLHFNISSTAPPVAGNPPTI